MQLFCLLRDFDGVKHKYVGKTPVISNIFKERGILVPFPFFEGVARQLFCL